MQWVTQRGITWIEKWFEGESGDGLFLMLHLFLNNKIHVTVTWIKRRIHVTMSYVQGRTKNIFQVWTNVTISIFNATIRICLTGIGWKSTDHGQSTHSELLERVDTITLYSHTIYKQHAHMPGFRYISKNHFPYFFNTFSTLNLISSILLLLFIFRNS